MDGLGWVRQDLRYTVRTFRRDRGSVALAVLALSLGIGAATVIFSVVYSVLVASFPFENPARVVHFYVHPADREGGTHWYPAPEFAEFRAQNSVFSHVLGGVSVEALYSIDNATYRVRGAFLDTQALSALGVRPVLGRDITAADGVPSAPPTFLMSDRLWEERFNRNPNVLGMTLKINGTIRTLTAVLPPRFLLQAADIFFPTNFTADLTGALVGGPGNRPLTVWTYARLKDGVTLEQAADNVAVIARNLSQVYPDRYPKNLKASVRSLADVYTAASLIEMVYILTGAVLMLLMIACSNVANLLLARATAREAELALRASLGASRRRLMQQLLTESFVLASIGGIIGALFAYGGIQWVRASIPVTALPSEMEIRFSGQALVAAVAITLLTAIACGLPPAFRAARGELRGRLMGSGRGAGVRSSHGHLRTLLVTVQVTLAIVLLIGAGLMMRTLLALQQVDLGLEPRNVLVGQLVFPPEQTVTVEERGLVMRRVVEKVGAVPGISAVTPSLRVPLLAGPTSPVVVTGTMPASPSTAAFDLVGELYFRILGVPLTTGRLLSAADVEGARPVAVVNQTFVRAFLGSASPLGRTVTLSRLDRGRESTRPSVFEIVGVVGDVHNGRLQDEVAAQVYVPFTSADLPVGVIVIKTTLDPRAIQHRVREAVWAADPNVALGNIGGARGSMVLEEILNASAFAAPKFGVGLLATFAGVGLVLSVIGVFSVMAYTVSLQTHDIGIRMALGATPERVMREVVLGGLRPIVAGVLLGAGASYALGRVLANHIYGVTTTDPATFAVILAVLSAVGVVACVLPARRALRVDPLIALRTE
jgi:putative ABC transport system permease protein